MLHCHPITENTQLRVANKRVKAQQQVMQFILSKQAWLRFLRPWHFATTKLTLDSFSVDRPLRELMYGQLAAGTVHTHAKVLRRPSDKGTGLRATNASAYARMPLLIVLAALQHIGEEYRLPRTSLVQDMVIQK